MFINSKIFDFRTVQWDSTTLKQKASITTTLHKTKTRKKRKICLLVRVQVMMISLSHIETNIVKAVRATIINTNMVSNVTWTMWQVQTMASYLVYSLWWQRTVDKASIVFAKSAVLKNIVAIVLFFFVLLIINVNCSELIIKN